MAIKRITKQPIRRITKSAAAPITATPARTPTMGRTPAPARVGTTIPRGNKPAPVTTQPVRRNTSTMGVAKKNKIY